MKNGWVTKRLGEVCEIINGKNQAEVADSSGAYPIYGSGGIMGRANSFRCPAGCTVIGRKGSINNPLYVAEPFWNVDTAYALSPKDVDAKYLFYFCRSFDFGTLNCGTTIPSLTTTIVKDVQMPLAPLAEQKRIVAKIDAAFEKIDRLKANAERNLANAKELFQSALNEAMRPKPGWVEKRLGEIGPVCMCKRILKSDTNPDSGVPFYKIGTFGKKANAFISNDLYQKFRSLYKFPKKGDVLISAAGTIGRTVVYDGEPAYFQDSNIVWIANDETEVLNAYLLLSYATSPWNVTKGATIPRLYNENIEQALIAFPCVNEQRVIVREFAELKSNIEILQSNYTRLVADCAEMRQAVLKEAFEGRL